MLVKVTKVMANVLNSELPEFSFSVEKHTTGWFSDPDDFDSRTGLTKVLVVRYPAHYYALPKSFTTKDLLDCYKRSDRSFTGFISQVKEMVMI